MKINGKKYETMKGAIKSLVEHMGGAESVKAFYARTLPAELAEQRKITRMVWDLWTTAERSILYHDDHPGFAQGHWMRVCPQVPGFSVYTDGVNDVHIETAIRKIGAELGIL